MFDTSKSPFVRLVSIPEGKFVYDVNTGMVCEIGADEYALLETLPWKSGAPPSAIYERLPEQRVAAALVRLEGMHSAGYLGENMIAEVEGAYDREVFSSTIESCCYRMALEITDSCNLRCGYCPFTEGGENSRPHGKEMMTAEIAELAVDYFMQHSVQRRHGAATSISFYGGEPLLNLELIRHVIEYQRRKWAYRTDVEWLVTTNGVLLSPKAWEVLVQYDVGVCVSVDATPPLHDRYRRTPEGRGTYQRVWSHVLYCKDKFRTYYDKKVSFNVGFSPPYDFESIRDYAAQGSGPLGTRNSCLGIYIDVSHSPSLLTEEEFRRTGRLLDRYRKEYLKLVDRTDALTGSDQQGLAYLETVVGREMTAFAKKIPKAPLARFGKRLPLGMPCNPGADKLLVRRNGDFHLCERGSYDEITRIGNVHVGIDEQRAAQAFAEYSVLRRPRCGKCWAIRCCSVCFAHMRAHNGHGDAQAWDRICEAQRNSIQAHLMWYCYALKVQPSGIDALAE